MTKIFVAKLDFGVSNEQLKSLFENYGEVIKATVAVDRETGKPRGFAFVEMSDAASASEAIKNLDGFAINGRNLAVKIAEDRPRQEARNNDRRPPFERKPNYDRPNNRGENNSTRSDASTNTSSFHARPTFTPEDFSTDISSNNRKKSKEKTRPDADKDGSSKKTKMNAYKKSNKFKFDLDEDENIEGSLFSFNDEEDDSLD